MSHEDHNYGTPPSRTHLGKHAYGDPPSHDMTRAVPQYNPPQQYTPRQPHPSAQQQWIQQAPYAQTQYQQPYAAPIITRSGPSGAVIAIAWIIAVITFFYMLPWAIAATRNKSNQGAIAVLNFFLGWSFIGWIVALVMACSAEQNKQILVVNQFHGGPQQYR